VEPGYREEFSERGAAMRRELELKRWKSRVALERLIRKGGL